MSIATRTGDRGQTALMYGRRLEKFDLRVEAYGTVDELNAALGLARAQPQPEPLPRELLAVQKQLVALMGELAVAPEDFPRYVKDGYPQLTDAMLDHLDESVKKLESEKIDVDGWSTPGADGASAALEFARTVCRRAERLVTKLATTSHVEPRVIKYLNRLSDVLWLMARYVETKRQA